MKILRTILMLVVLAVLITGCVKTPSETSPDPAGFPDDTTPDDGLDDIEGFEDFGEEFEDLELDDLGDFDINLGDI